MRVGVARALADLSDWASGGAKFPKMEDSLIWTPINRCAKFAAARFILGGEIRNPANKKANKQTIINDISAHWRIQGGPGGAMPPSPRGQAPRMH